VPLGATSNCASPDPVIEACRRELCRRGIRIATASTRRRNSRARLARGNLPECPRQHDPAENPAGGARGTPLRRGTIRRAVERVLWPAGADEEAARRSSAANRVVQEPDCLVRWRAQDSNRVNRWARDRQHPDRAASRDPRIQVRMLRCERPRPRGDAISLLASHPGRKGTRAGDVRPWTLRPLERRAHHLQGTTGRCSIDPDVFSLFRPAAPWGIQDDEDALASVRLAAGAAGRDGWPGSVPAHRVASTRPRP
jgi:hypothetical protein